MDCIKPTCDQTVVSGKVWEAMTKPARAKARKAGTRRMAGRGLCSGCWDEARRTGTLADYERRTTPREVVLEEWERRDKSPGQSRAQQARNLAPRLGMTPEALERALDRAGVAA